MAEKAMSFDEYLAREIEKYKGVCVPVHSSLLRRRLVRKLSPYDMHPNPEDEFSQPEIGPNHGIIADYEKQFRTMMHGNYMHAEHFHGKHEPLTVERMKPDGYLILNGHHRWAAALRANMPSLPVKIVNLTQEKDIRRMLAASSHHRRVSLDLDEVIFSDPKEGPGEQARFPWNFVYRQPMRLGFPALARFFNRRGYDIWVYSAAYHSQDYIDRWLRRHRVHVNGIITGTARKVPESSRKAMEALLSAHYQETIHIDRNLVLKTESGTKGFQEFPLSGNAESWSREIMDIIPETEKA